MKNKITQFQELALKTEGNVKRTVVAALCILAVLVSMYVYFVGKIVFDVVGRRTAETSIRGAQSSISSLEVAYFNQLKTLDLAAATSIGLTETHAALYASRAVLSKTVGMANTL